MLAYLTGLGLALVPEAWRQRWFRGIPASLVSGAIVTGVLQLLLCLAALGWRYPAFVRSQFTGGVTRATMAAAESGGETAVMGLGPLLLVAYLFQPLSVVLLYFMFEGVVRATAAVVNSEVLPTMPLFLLSLLDARAREYRREQAMGPRIVDVVQVEGASDLLIASCRPKLWTQLTTIRYQDQLYELAKTNQGAAPRRYLYRLRRIPPHKLVRGVHDYALDEALPEKERLARAAATAASSQAPKS
ncbi:MAG: hypothetical protein M3P27_11290 [Acidobacteriota bacterium]|nr:hypothetical protein [Acidobacteriota bacterium]